jgi:SAM-dependent methyltransferase
LTGARTCAILELLNRARSGLMADAVNPNWWSSLYDDIVADILLAGKDANELAGTLDFLCERLELRPGMTVLDQCCGIGNLALPLARRGARVVGIDQCAAYIERAARRAAAEGLDCRFHVGDAANFLPDEPADAVVNWGTSFGYGEDGGNCTLLRRAYEALRPGGRLVLDVLHVARVMRQFQPVLLHRSAGEGGETLVVRESRLDLAGGALRQRWTFLFPNGRREERGSAIKLYLPHVLAAMLAACNFADVRFFGGVGGEELSLESPRCMVLARRPTT